MVVKLVHVRRNEQQADRPVRPQRQRHIRVGHVGEKNSQDAVKNVIAHRRPRDEHGQQGKAFANHKIQRVVAGAGCHIHVGVAVVHLVQAPEGQEHVEQVVHRVLRHEVQHHNRHKQFRPDRPVHERQQAPVMRSHPSENADGRRAEQHVDRHCRRQERQVDPGMLPGPVAA